MGLIDENSYGQSARDGDHPIKNKLKLSALLISFFFLCGLSLNLLGWGFENKRPLGTYGFTACAFICFGFAQVAGYYILRTVLK
jgi:hypothetical protein